MTNEDRADRTIYHCLVGHEIPVSELAAQTEVTLLDRGAEVRICRTHGAPIAVTVAPLSAAEERVE